MNTVSEDDIDGLCQALLLLNNKRECRKFLRDLLTEAEIKEFTNRWKVAQMLNDKMPYELIAKKTGMSSTTIARVGKWLKKGKGGYRLALGRLANHHSTPRFPGGVVIGG